MLEIHLLADTAGPLAFASIFGRFAPLEVDLGCGDGAFLAQLAEATPDHNFLGVERLLGRVRSACFQLNHRRLSNARVLRADTVQTVTDLLPPGSVDVFHLMFPDPWPKRRHHHRRVVNGNFLGLVHRALRKSGTIRIVTDHAEYFAEICADAARKPGLFVQTNEQVSLLATSTFERKYRENGRPIHRIALRKIDGVR